MAWPCGWSHIQFLYFPFPIIPLIREKSLWVFQCTVTNGSIGLPKTIAANNIQTKQKLDIWTIQKGLNGTESSTLFGLALPYDG